MSTFLDLDYELLVSNTSTNGTCGGEGLESGLQVFLGVFLAVGAFVAYLPQVIEIIWKRSAEGVSYLSIFLAHTAGLASLWNGVFIKWEILYCCLHEEFAICAESLLVVVSLFVPVLGQTCIWIVLLVFFNRGADREKRRECRFAGLAFVVDWFLGAICLVVCSMLLWKLGSKSKPLLGFANALGIAGAVLTSVQWVPQIWQTWKAGHRGSLSLVMLCIQCPGSVLIVVYFGIVRHYPVTTWIPYAVAAIMQATLITMLIYYWIRDRRAAAKALPPQPDQEATEPLMTDVGAINGEGSLRKF